MILTLPISTDLNQTFTATLGSVGTFDFRVYWNARALVWQMDISNTDTQAVVISGLRLAVGSDLLAAYGLRPTFGAVVVIDVFGSGDDPTIDGFGSAHLAGWFSPDEFS